MKPVYLYFGEEHFLKEKEGAKLLAKLLPAGRNAFNFASFSAADSSGEEVRGALLTPSFTGEQKVVLVRHLDAWKAADSEGLLPLFANWPPKVTLLLWGEKVDKRTKLYKEVAKLGEAREFKKLSSQELSTWLVRQGQEGHNLEIGRDVAANMIRLAGDNLGVLDQELAKLAAYLGPENNKPQLKDLEAVTWQAAGVNVFALTDALGQRNRKKALALLDQILEDGAEPLSLLGTMAWQLRNIFKVKAAGLQRQQELKLHPFVLRRCQEQARYFQRQERAFIFRALFEADLALKSGQEDAFVLEELVLKLCSGRESKD